MPPILALIDGHALAYRTYFALTSGNAERWRTSNGEPTAGVYGFVSVLLRILQQERPDYLAVAFDTGKTFRDDLYPEYKGTRAKMPDDLRTQIERIRQVVDALGVPRLEVEGYEADDVLGSVAHQAAGHGLGVKIFTGDRDLLQLVDDRIVVNLPGRSLSDARDYDSAGVRAYLGVHPKQVVDLKALMGDSSDNIPGVPGIGQKTAVSLLETHENLEAIYADLESYKPGVRKKLEEGRELAFLSRKLARIVTDVPVPLDLEAARLRQLHTPELRDIFQELEFSSMLTRLRELEQLYSDQPAGAAAYVEGAQLSLFGEASPPAASAPPQGGAPCEVIDTPQALARLARMLSQATVIAFDTETTSTDQMSADLVGISLAVSPERGYYIPVGHTTGTQLPLKTVLDALRPALTDARIPKVGHNVKYDFVVLSRHGLEVKPLAFDTMLAEWLIDPDSRNLGLKRLAFVRLQHEMISIQSLIGSGKNQRSMAEVPIAQAAPYAADDAAVVLRLMPILEKELAERQATRLLHEMEMPLVPVLAGMEMAGISLDVPFLARMSGELAVRLSALEQQVHEIAGEVFNLNSTQQLSRILFDRLGLQPPQGTRRTAHGTYSTSASVLEALTEAHPIVLLVLEYRELAKLKSTYVDTLPKQVNPHTGRVHTSYNQTGSVTGRLASTDPNLQNIPIRSELGRQVRCAFVAAPGHYLVSVDYSQVELRLAAHMSQDEAMIAAFQAGQDIHAATAAAIYGIPIAQVSKEQRRHAKAINFGLIYGMSAYGLTRSSDLTLAEAENFVAAYFQQFPGVQRFLDDLRLQATRQGYVETLFGRRRYFPELQREINQNARNRAEREAINAPIQGTAADILKQAMLALMPALRQAGLAARPLLQVHDELVLECPTKELQKTVRVVREVMEKTCTLRVPLATEARYGLNWGEMQVVESE
ncbi:MAG: DNA polymerase I [Anaerolineales bacterium]